jgi:hypothetical protein
MMAAKGQVHIRPYNGEPTIYIPSLGAILYSRIQHFETVQLISMLVRWYLSYIAPRASYRVRCIPSNQEQSRLGCFCGPSMHVSHRPSSLFGVGSNERPWMKWRKGE